MTGKKANSIQENPTLFSRLLIKNKPFFYTALYVISAY